MQKMERLRKGEKGSEGPAPHKPVLLLAVIDLIRQGQIRENKIFPSPDLAEMFMKYWLKVAIDRTPNFAMPFFHLKGEKFWHLHPNIGKEGILKNVRRVRKVSDLLEIVNYARLDDELFVLLTSPQDREAICRTLVNKHFPNSTHAIENLIAEEQQIGNYRQLLIQEVTERPFIYEEQAAQMEAEKPTRSAAFRREIMRTYKYTCAVCRLRVVTMEGESLTQAAHIIPFSVAQNDDVRNGISLCRSHHWAFDIGLISLNKTYKVIVSEQMSEEGPTGQMLRELNKKPILLPEHKLLYPAQEALAWHRKKVLRK